MITYREFRGISYIDFPKNYCVIDLETTGLSSSEGDIIEIGAIKFSGSETVDQFQTLVRPPASNFIFVDDFITDLTGITNEMISEAPETKEVLNDFSEFLGDSVIVGYNVSFDVNFLYDSYMKYLKRPFVNNFIDVLRLSRRLCPELPSRCLSDMVKYFNLDISGGHRAICDCVATELVYKKLRDLALNTWGNLDAFCQTFKKSRVKPNATTVEKIKLEKCETKLLNCKSVRETFEKVIEFNLSNNELKAFAKHLKVRVNNSHKKSEIITEIVFAVIDKKLRSAQNATFGQ